MSVVHIHARDIARHDAVGNFARQVAVLVQDHGWQARLWAGHADTFERNPVRPRAEFWNAVEPSDVIFFNFSIFDPDLERLAALPNRKVLYFHNITPPELIDPEDWRTIENCRKGLEQRPLAGAFDALMANSAASAAVLVAGMSEPPSVTVCPPIIDLDRWAKVVASPAADDGRRRLLYVGRLVPNKGVMELLDMFALLAARVPDIALDLIGAPPHGDYVDRLRQRAAEVLARIGAPIQIRHGVSDSELKASYIGATACITMSRHEGFCVPAVDALAFGKPFFATPLPAVDEVLGGASIVLPFDQPEQAATIMAEALANRAFLAARTAAGTRRLIQFRERADGRIILDTLEAVRSR